jgi:hypothetical protein
MKQVVLAQRIAKLDELKSCPVCGAPLVQKCGGHKNRKMFFDCSAIFMANPNAPIEALLPCPKPSVTAAMILDAEIHEASTAFARTSAGTPPLQTKGQL